MYIHGINPLNKLFFVVCTVKWQTYSIIFCLFCTCITGEWGFIKVFAVPAPPLIEVPLY